MLYSESFLVLGWTPWRQERVVPRVDPGGNEKHHAPALVILDTVEMDISPCLRYLAFCSQEM